MKPGDRAPLLEYLDKLEATARAAVDGRWSRNSDQILSDLGPSTPMYDGRLIAESCEQSNAEHIVATQPRATLALIDRLRRYHKALAELCNEIALNSEDPDDASDIRALLSESFEVPS